MWALPELRPIRGQTKDTTRLLLVYRLVGKVGKRVLKVMVVVVVALRIVVIVLCACLLLLLFRSLGFAGLARRDYGRL